MKKLIIDLNDNRELVAFYTESQSEICVRSVFIYDDKGDETHFDSEVTGDTLEEIKEELLEEYDTQNNCCSICGKELEPGEVFYRTEDGKVACSLTELLSELSGKGVN